MHAGRLRSARSFGAFQCSAGYSREEEKSERGGPVQAVAKSPRVFLSSPSSGRRALRRPMKRGPGRALFRPGGDMKTSGSPPRCFPNPLRPRSSCCSTHARATDRYGIDEREIFPLTIAPPGTPTCAKMHGWPHRALLTRASAPRGLPSLSGVLLGLFLEDGTPILFRSLCGSTSFKRRSPDLPRSSRWNFVAKNFHWTTKGSFDLI
ncbi:hypothetical protein HPB50_024940 [Hyalomma asiaticum]|uniref:Uncharacterized protein n=1 Tax=Hyalomma asiaticum TaxID=266040 RepID=A0ACB7TNC7_HYAAI|nr:hypothetical protein HPB50_024940 [Hyalomma asiaticum]